MMREIVAVFTAFKEWVLGLPISETQKADGLRYLATIPLIFDNVTEAQNKTYQADKDSHPNEAGELPA